MGVERDQDQKLLSQLKSGDLAVYETIFKKYYKLLIMEAFYILKEELEAESLVQDLFIEFWDKELYQEIDLSLADYLQACIRRKCLDSLAASPQVSDHQNKFHIGYHIFNDRSQ